MSFRTARRFASSAALRVAPQTNLEPVAVSTGQPIEPVELNCEYLVRFEISDGGLDKLMHLLEGPKP